MQRTHLAMRDRRSIFSVATHRERPRAYKLANRLPLQKFRHDIRSAFVITDLVDGKDIGMVGRSGALRFLRETPQAIGIARVGCRNQFDGDVAVEREASRAR